MNDQITGEMLKRVSDLERRLRDLERRQAPGYLTAVEIGQALTLDEVSENPTDPSPEAQCRVYMKGDLFVISFRHGSEDTHYFILNLAGSSGNWLHQTSAP